MSEFIGIDISKAVVDVMAHASGMRVQAQNNDEGLKSLCETLQGLAPELVVMEASGGYERLCAATLAQAGLPVVVVNARQVRAFALATGVLAKTDAVDARVLAHFAAAVRPAVRALADAQRQGLEEIMGRRRQLTGMLVMEKNRLAQARNTGVRGDIKTLIAVLEKRIGNCDGELQRQIEASPVWRAQADLLRSFKGIGPVNVRVLLINLPEPGRLNRKQIACLAGLAPIARDSGRHQGRRSIAGGRAHVRAALYTAAVAAIRSNALIRDFHQRLRDSGKPAKLALVACMRKILTILNAMMRNHTHWQGA